MTPVGHSLMGTALGLTVMPRGGRLRTKTGFLLVFAVLANLPDARLPFWGHHRYDISHSIFSNLTFILPLAAVLLAWPRARRAIGGAPVVIAGSLAWLSHLLLDSFYNHGLGIAIFWPISKARLVLPMPWFSTLRGGFPHLDAHAVRVAAVELVFYGTVVALVWLVRWLWLTRVQDGATGGIKGRVQNGDTIRH